MFQRRKDVSEVGQAVLRPGLGHDCQAVGPFAPGDRGLPFAVAAVEHQDGFAGGQPQHIAEIIALVALERDRLARRQRGVDKQPGAAKIELRHESMFQSARPFSPKVEFTPIIGVPARPYAALLPNSTGC